MRESRFLLSLAEARAVTDRMPVPLAYRVTNLYLDDAGGNYSHTGPGSPRFRVRLYEAGGFRFGRIERKSVEAVGERRKRAWRLDDRLGDVLPALPALSDPPVSSPFHCLVLEREAGEPLDVQGVTFLGSLGYERLAWQHAEGRLTLDSAFVPALAAPGGTRVETILEIKGTPPPLLATGELRPLEESKFALLMRSLRAA